MTARLGQVFPCWLVMWGAYSREFWAYPVFGGPVEHSPNPNDLAGMMHRAQRFAADRR